MRRPRPALIPVSFWLLLIGMGVILVALSAVQSSATPAPTVIYCDPEPLGEEPDGYGTRYRCVNNPDLIISLAH
jgi:hypothetical protein